MNIGLGSLGPLAANKQQSSSVPRPRLSINTPASESGSFSPNVSQAAYSSLALSGTANNAAKKIDVLDNQINEVNRLLQIADKIQNSTYSGQTSVLYADAQARTTAAISAYSSALNNDSTLDDEESQQVNTAPTYDPYDTEDAAIIRIGQTSSPTEAGINSTTFDDSSNSIDETITALEDARFRFQSERAALGSNTTAISSSDERAQKRAADIKASEEAEPPPNPADAIKEASEKILADGTGTDAAISSSIASLLDSATKDDEEDNSSAPEVEETN